jgi:hypothetical protein
MLNVSLMLSSAVRGLQCVMLTLPATRCNLAADCPPLYSVSIDNKSVIKFELKISAISWKGFESFKTECVLFGGRTP